MLTLFGDLIPNFCIIVYSQTTPQGQVILQLIKIIVILEANSNCKNFTLVKCFSKLINASYMEDKNAWSIFHA